MIGGWRELYDEELHYLYPSSRVVGCEQTNEDMMGYVLHKGARINALKVLGTGGKIILNFIFLRNSL